MMDGLIGRLENPTRVAELAPADTLKRIGLSEGGTFCDIGAGPGVFALPAADISKSTVYAVDISEEMRDILRRKINGIDIEILDSIHAVRDSFCDVALLCAVLHELEDVPDMSAQIRRVLKEDGVLSVIEFHKSQTPIGPPPEERLSEDAAISMLSSDFRLTERFSLGENYYCLVFRKK